MPGTNSQGKDWEEALYMARDALASWLEYLRDKGMDIPDASSPAALTVDLDRGDFVQLIEAEVE